MADEAAFWRGMTWVVAAYFAAFAVGILTVVVLPEQDPLVRGLIADLTATLVIFGFSVAFRNASFYDAYWSVAPIALVAYWSVGADDGNPIRQALVLGVVAFWGTRLTTNWASGWKGLGHEDWRYVDLRHKTRWAYPAVNLFGIHYFPTLLVFAGLWPAYVAVTTSSPIGLLDLLAFLVAGGATVIEGVSDRQLHAFQARGPAPEAYIDEGLWRWSRHPNYFGEVLFWWGMWLFGVAADASKFYTIVGALLMAALFRFISIPLMEARMLRKQPSYADQIGRVPMLLPWPPRHPPVDQGDDPSGPQRAPVVDRLTDENTRLAIDTLPFIPPPDERDDD